MIGEAQIQLRAQLGTALFSTLSLAGELQIGTQSSAKLQELGQCLRQPFLIVVLGERGSGKRALLDALFGSGLWKGEGSPNEKVSVWRYAAASRDCALSAQVAEHERAATILRDFTIVLSAGTPCAESRQFLQDADLVLVVLGLTTESNRTHQELLKLSDGIAAARTAFVLIRPEAELAPDVEAIQQRLEQAISQHLGESRLVFRVAPRAALEMKVAGRGSVSSGLHSLEVFIEAHLAGLEPRRTRMRALVRGVTSMLNELRARVAEIAAVVNQDDLRRQALTETLIERKEQSLRQIGGFLWALAQTYETTQKKAEELLRAQLTPSAMLTLIVSGTPRPNALRDEVGERLQQAVGHHIDNSVHALDVVTHRLLQPFPDLIAQSIRPGGATHDQRQHR